MSAHAEYKDRAWSPQPRAEAVYQQVLRKLLGQWHGAKQFEASLLDLAGLRIRDLVDHLSLADTDDLALLEEAGWATLDGQTWRNEAGHFPPIRKDKIDSVWFRVESAAEFLAAHKSDASIEGPEHGPMRISVFARGTGLEVGVVERSGHPGFDVPETDPGLIRKARLHLQKFKARRRQFDTVEQGLSYTEVLVDAAVTDLGAHWACDLWLKAERDFWMTRCPSGRIQKARQDLVGVGWCNIDHHTYDSSREHFRHTIRILEKLGYELREMLYAGELAGWGSQVLEQPVIGSTIFADVDLAPEELTVDFAHEPLPQLDRHRRAGLLSELLGESILEAGLNHVAGLYDQKVLRRQLVERGISMMKPFTDWPHLYQELSHGDWGAVDPDRVDRLEAGGHIDKEEAERLRLEGSIITHLENIERNDGYKGFNREGIDSVLRKLDPRAYLAEGFTS